MCGGGCAGGGVHAQKIFKMTLGLTHTSLFFSHAKPEAAFKAVLQQSSCFYPVAKLPQNAAATVTEE